MLVVVGVAEVEAEVEGVALGGMAAAAGVAVAVDRVDEGGFDNVCVGTDDNDDDVVVVSEVVMVVVEGARVVSEERSCLSDVETEDLAFLVLRVDFVTPPLPRIVLASVNFSQLDPRVIDVPPFLLAKSGLAFLPTLSNKR